MSAGNGVAAPGERAAAANAAGSGWNPFDLLHGYVKRGVDYIYDDIVAAIVWCAVLTAPEWRSRPSGIIDSCSSRLRTLSVDTTRVIDVAAPFAARNNWTLVLSTCM